MPAAARRDRVLPSLVALIAISWVALIFWGASPYARYLDHGEWTEIGVTGSLCGVVPGGGATLTALVFLGGWLLMLTAMMLPTTLPLLDIFRRLTAGRPDRRQLIALVIAGYLGVWLLFGIAVHAADWAILVLVRQSLWLTANGWAIGAAVLAGAGLYQFSRPKYTCLDRCRAPFGFVVERWRGRGERRQAFLLGLGHGAFCVGCCWSLMLLMVALGGGNIGWMLGIGAIMAAEKNFSWGRRLAAPLGTALIAAAVAVTVY
jgi:predicted metal-binding membrane protein